MKKTMNEEILVSIIVPVFNEEKYLKQCLDSLICQTHSNLQIICVDDGSTDSSPEILQQYAREDSRITILNQKNKYAGVARNKGFECAEGKYVMFLDSDDFFHETLIEKTLNEAETTCADIVICGSEKYDDKTKEYKDLSEGLNVSIIPESLPFSPKEVADHIYQFTAGWPWDKLYKTEFVRNNNVTFQNTRIANDEFFVDVCYAVADRISVVSDILVYHRSNVESSLEFNREIHWKCGYDMAYALKDELKRRGIYELYRASYTKRIRRYLFWLLSSARDYSNYMEMYAFLQNRAIKELDLLYEGFEVIDEPQLKEIRKIAKYSIGEYLFNKINKKDIKRWRFNINSFPPNSRFVVYGYGKVGRDIVDQIKNNPVYSLIGIVDKNKGGSVGPILNDISVIDFQMYDYVIIAILDRDTVKGINNQLIQSGVDGDKICVLDSLERC